MGNKNSNLNQNKLEELSEDLKLLVIDTFKVFDKDGSKEIDLEEALGHWKNNFARLSAKEFFQQVDFDGNGKISEDEFMQFWTMAKAHGVSEEEIQTELENIKNGESWVGFHQIPSNKKINSMSGHNKSSKF